MSLKNHSTSERRSSIAGIRQDLLTLMSLEAENAKLLACEKLTLLLSKIALVAVAILGTACGVVFLSMGFTHLLLEVMKPVWAYVIVGGVYLLLTIFAVVMRKPLIINPIARSISKIILSPHSTSQSHDED